MRSSRGAVYEIDVLPLQGTWRGQITSVALLRDRVFIGFDDGSLRVGSTGL